MGRLFGIVLAIALGMTFLPTAEAARVHGAAISDETVKVGASRYRSRRDWDRTLRFFYRVYGKKSGVVFRRIATTPRVKAMFIENANPGQGWEGINVYQVNGKVFIYVIASDAPAPPTKKRRRR